MEEQKIKEVGAAEAAEREDKMALFEKKPAQAAVPEVAEYDKQIAQLAQRRAQLVLQVGQMFLDANKDLEGSPYEENAKAIMAIDKETDFLEKRKLAVQGLRKCEKCGNILVLDSSFCNKCGEKLEPLFAEEMKKQSICPKCGSAYEEGAMFCTSCGNKLG